MSCLIPGNHIVWLERIWCEPTTVVTDLILAAQCGLLMLRHRGSARGFFALSGLAFALGGFRHLVVAEWGGLVPVLSRASSTASALSLALLVAALPALWSHHRGRVVVGAWSLTVVMTLGHLWLDHFSLNVLHTAIVFIGTLLVVAARGQWEQNRWFAVAFLLSLLAGVIFAAQLAPAFFFNHNDLAHVVLMGSHYALHRQLLAGRQAASLGGSRRGD